MPVDLAEESTNSRTTAREPIAAPTPTDSDSISSRSSSQASEATASDHSPPPQPSSFKLRDASSASAAASAAEITHPAPIHHPTSSDRREATELEPIASRASGAASQASGRSYHRYEARRTPVPVHAWERKVAGPVRKFWVRQVRVDAPETQWKDHLAHERTFLGYLRTSVSLSMTGVVIAQLFRLQQGSPPTPADEQPRLSYFHLGIPLAASYIAASIAICLLAAFRFWRQQNAIVRGRYLAGGWELYAIMAGSVLLLACLFAVTVGADVEDEV